MAETVGQHRVRGGGLMRCCLATLGNHADEPVPPDRTLTCDYGTSRMRLADDDVWEWLPEHDDDQD